MAVGASHSGVVPAADGSAAGDDLALIGRVRAGDRECFYTLVSRYERGLYRAALAIMRKPEDAEEVVQETFLRALRHLDQFRGESKFHTWLTQIALNAARMKLRKAHSALWESLDEPVPTEDAVVTRQVADRRENPEQAVGREQLAAMLHQAMGGLAQSYREVLVLRDIQMLSTQETAEVLHLSVANVKTRLLRARMQLRARLAPHLTLSGERGAGAGRTQIPPEPAARLEVMR